MLIEGSNFTIKDVDGNDINAIFEVYKQCEDFLSLGPASFASRQMIYNDFKLSKEEGGTFCGIFLNGKMIGVVDFVSGNYDGNPENAYLALLMISAGHRRNGIGSEVVNAVETEILKNRNIKFICAGVQTNNKPAIAFWLKMGYKIVGDPELMPDTTIVFHLKKDVLYCCQYIQNGI
ncbi:MAG: GNAT family N-acetyltransferase [Ruminiclostridium sp.]|nr:GNAT family N-acetyltransferase [Ruminiclostridium sp.]